MKVGQPRSFVYLIYIQDSEREIYISIGIKLINPQTTIQSLLFCT